MRRDRFEEIMKYNRLSPTDKYTKVRTLLNMFNHWIFYFGAALGANDIAIDESVIFYYGRHTTKQFILVTPFSGGRKHGCQLIPSAMPALMS